MTVEPWLKFTSIAGKLVSYACRLLENISNVFFTENRKVMASRRQHNKYGGGGTLLKSPPVIRSNLIIQF